MTRRPCGLLLLILFAVVLGGALAAKPTAFLPVAVIPLVIIALATLRRRLVVTERRVVEYRPLLAWLASLARFMRPFERRGRVVFELSDVANVSVTGSTVFLYDHQGGVHTLNCATVGEASDVAHDIRRLSEARAKELSAAIRSQVKLESGERIPAEPGPDTRCPYCHDDLPAAEAVLCPECSAPHHDECLEIHGKCAILGCNGRLAKRRRRRTGRL